MIPEAKLTESGYLSSPNIAANVSKALVAAAGFNVEAPIVNALIGNLTGSLSTEKFKRSESLRCKVCDCEVSSPLILEFHLNGSKHKKKLKAQRIIENLKADEQKGIQVNEKSLSCEICSLTVNSALQLEFHLSGAKHKKKADKVKTLDNYSNNSGKTSEETSDPPAKKTKKNETKMMTCDVCHLVMNSQVQFDQHLSSRKHQAKARSLPGRQEWHQEKMKTSFMYFKNYNAQSLM